MSNHEAGWRIASMIAIGFVMVVVGLGLATNFRGLAEKHIDISLKWSRPIERLSPLGASPSKGRRSFAIFLDRVAGVIFALIGFGILGTGIVFAIGRVI